MSAASAPARLVSFLRETLRDDFSGQHGPELLAAQRQIILQRTIVLIWISVFVMPTTIWAYVFFAKPDQLLRAIVIVLGAIGIALTIGALVKRGLFDKHYHLSMVLLVGGVFGPTGTAITEITHGSGGDFFFAFFLIYFAFASLFPASAVWVLITSAAIVGSWLGGRLLRADGFVADQRFYENLLYFFQLTFISTVLNRVLVKLFRGERVASLELRLARDALLSEMKVAQQIQRLLLPQNPQLPGFDVYGVMFPADDVGGDYYDVITTKTGRRFVAIGDVSGHGVTAGVTMMMARSTLVATLEADPQASLTALYISVNRGLYENLRRMDLKMYMTFAIFEHLGAGDFKVVGCHLPAMAFRAATGAVEEIPVEGTWLGILEDLAPADCPEVALTLSAGDTLVLYTDGIVERRKPSGTEMFGFERFTPAIAANATKGGAAQTVDGVIAAMVSHSTLQDDDVTVLALRYQG